MAPGRRGDVAQVAIRAWISGTYLCFLRECVARLRTQWVGCGIVVARAVDPVHFLMDPDLKLENENLTTGSKSYLNLKL